MLPQYTWKDGGEQAGLSRHDFAGIFAFHFVPECPERSHFSPSHGGNRGSNPLGDANHFNALARSVPIAVTRHHGGAPDSGLYPIAMAPAMTRMTTVAVSGQNQRD